MFQDEAGFGRINTPKYCWCEKGYRPSVPCHHIREYIYAYGAVDSINGDDFFLVLPKCNTICMNLFLQKLSEAYPDDVILICCDGAAWHKSGTMEIPENIELFFIPPYTPEMNPIEQIWKELRQTGFRNEAFATLEKVIDRLCDSIKRLSKQTVQSITGRQWILRCFNWRLVLIALCARSILNGDAQFCVGNRPIHPRQLSISWRDRPASYLSRLPAAFSGKFYPKNTPKRMQKGLW